jgi:hypothetical protein
MWEFSGVATTLSVIAIVFTWRNYVWTRYASVRENQARIRADLKDLLHPFDYWRIEKTLNQLQSRHPSISIQEDLRKLGDYVSFHKDEFVAPTPNQLQTLADSIETTRRMYDATRAVPTDDRVFDGDYQHNQRRELAKQFERLRAEVRCVVSGLNRIQREVLSTRRQIKLFARLGA